MSDRIQRPFPERTYPNRNPSDVLRGLGGNHPAGDPLARSVGVGYRIVEQYLEQSRAHAAGVAPKSTNGGGNVVADLATRMIRTTADLFEVWLQLLDVTGSPQAEPRAPSAESPDGGNAPTTTRPVEEPGASTGLVVELRSARPASVAVDIRPRTGGTAMVVHSLRSRDESLPRISLVSVQPSVDGGPVRVSVDIPEDQPAGIYNGMILDEASSVPIGTISVRLEDAEASV